MRGLPVTTTSKPDLAPLDNRNGELQIWMGELKNHNNYTEKNAQTQCLMYLVGTLYWLRSVLGRPVESIYGFYFCGCRCSDRNQDYSIGLLKLSAPQYLGDTMSAECFQQEGDVDDPLPLQLLVHFFTYGKRWTISQQPKANNPMPCLFVLPTQLWKNDSDRELVVHGTLSIVFRITAAGLDLLLRNDQSKHFGSLATNAPWQEYCDNICGIAQQTSDGGVRFFLKIRSRDSSWSMHPMGAMGDVWDILEGHREYGFLDTYICGPFVTKDFGVILMKDRGRQLKQVASLDAAILDHFSNIMKMAMFLAEHFPHGDVLPHNLVFDEATQVLTLIDIDEGVKSGKRGSEDHLLQRKNEYNNDGDDWYIAMSYPNALRTAAYLYTKCQLTATFLYLVGRVENLSSQSLEMLDALADETKKLGDELCTLDKDDKKINHKNKDNLTAMVNKVYGMVVKIVKSK